MKILNVVVLSVTGSLAVAAFAAYTGQTVMGAAANDPKVEAVVNPNGDLRVPADYRASYQFLGSWAIAADKGQGAQQIHVVYASPGTIEAYHTNGHFADGSVLVKEVFEAATQPMKTGTVSRAQKLKGWFVMVKDSKDSHPGNSLWGDGWAWSWFDADNPSKTTSSNYKIDCLSCHQPARATDWVYVEGYPPLNRAH